MDLAIREGVVGGVRSDPAPSVPDTTDLPPEILERCRDLFGAIHREAMGKTFTELEELVLKRVVSLGQTVLESALAVHPLADPEKEGVCSGCHKRLRIQKEEQARTLPTRLGPISYNRPYAVCDRCQRSGAPMDHELGIPPLGVSIGLLEHVCHAAMVGRSFDDAREILEVHSRIPMSAKHVRTLAEEEGRRLVEERTREVTSFEAGALRFQSDLEVDLEVDLLVVVADGGRVQTRQPDNQDRWKEDKIGVVYDAVPHPEGPAPTGDYEGAQARTKTYGATMQSWEKMGWILRVEAERRGYGKAKEKLFLSDGAKVLRELKNFQFPEATFILDWAHAAEHLSDCAKALFGEGTSEARRWYDRLKTQLWEGQTSEIIAELQKQSRRMGEPRSDDGDTSARVLLHRNAFSYFPNNQEAINYPLFRSRGWPIGSGVAEGAVKQVALRMKGSEMFWNVEHTGAEEMLALCALYHSEDHRWRRHWKKRAQARPWS